MIHKQNFIKTFWHISVGSVNCCLVYLSFAHLYKVKPSHAPTHTRAFIQSAKWTEGGREKRSRGAGSRGGSSSFMLMSFCLQAASEVLPGYRPSKAKRPINDYATLRLACPQAVPPLARLKTCDSHRGRWMERHQVVGTGDERNSPGTCRAREVYASPPPLSPPFRQAGSAISRG